jgi:hypothetical protein
MRLRRRSQQQKSGFTLLLVPHDGSRSFVIGLSRRFFIAILFTLTVTLTWGGFSIHYFKDYQETLLENEILKGKLQYFLSEMTSIKKKAQNIEVIDQQLRELFYVDLDEVIPQSEVSGGPSISDMVQVASLLRENHDPVTYQFKKDMDTLDEVITRTDKGLDEIDDYLKRQREIWQATPSIWPAPGRITSKYGYRNFKGKKEFHHGVDIRNRRGTPIRATADGKVTLARRSGGYGLLVVVDHGNGFQTRYAHLKKIPVKKGDRLEKGDIVGYMGATGKATGTHLHYEVRMLTRSIDPLNYM